MTLISSSRIPLADCARTPRAASVDTATQLDQPPARCRRLGFVLDMVEEGGEAGESLKRKRRVEKDERVVRARSLCETS